MHGEPVCWLDRACGSRARPFIVTKLLLRVVHGTEKFESESFLGVFRTPAQDSMPDAEIQAGFITQNAF